MRPSLQDLIVRMCSNVMPAPRADGAIHSEDSVGWKAYREAETVANDAFVDELALYIEEEPTPERRGAACFILGNIGAHGPTNRCAEALFSALGREATTEGLSGILFALGRMPRVDLAEHAGWQRVCALLQDRRGTVRHDAIMAIFNAGPSAAEPALLDFVRQTESADELEAALSAVGRVGSHASVPQLLLLCDHRSERVAAAALAALLAITGGEQLATCVTCLANGRATTRWTAMEGIERFGGRTEVAPVLARVRAILRRPPRIGQMPRSELLMGLTFLWRFADVEPKVLALFDTELPRRLQALTDEERSQLAALTR